MMPGQYKGFGQAQPQSPPSQGTPYNPQQGGNFSAYKQPAPQQSQPRPTRPARPGWSGSPGGPGPQFLNGGLVAGTWQQIGDWQDGKLAGAHVQDNAEITKPGGSPQRPSPDQPAPYQDQAGWEKWREQYRDPEPNYFLDIRPGIDSYVPYEQNVYANPALRAERERNRDAYARSLGLPLR